MTVWIAAVKLRELVTAIFVRCGLAPDDASSAAEAVCYADEHGVTTHGCHALATIYAPRLRDGRIKPTSRPEVVAESAAGVVVNGHGCLGSLAMTQAVDLAARKAREHGVGLALVRGSSHFGSAGYYSLRLAQAGLVGLTMTNCGRQRIIPPLGGAAPMLGTNPLAAAVPAGSRAPFALDMSTTVVAAGKVAAALAEGRDVPPGWLVGRDGAFVTDPAAYYDGRADVAWLGGQAATGAAKGYGLALLVDLLCGPLAGAGYGPRRVPDGEHGDDSDVGHVALAIDPAAFGRRAEFLAQVDEVLSALEECPPAGNVTYPGAEEARRAAESVRYGVALPDHVAAELRQLSRELGIEAE